MSRNILIIVTFISFFSSNFHAYAADNHQAASLLLGGYAAYDTYSPTETLANSIINKSRLYTILKGVIGERIMHDTLRMQGWNFVHPNLGSTARQGIDGIYIKYDAQGNPRQLMVGEAKYGTSQLNMTKDGQQSSTAWYNARLKQTSQRYAAGAKAFRDQASWKRSNTPPPAEANASRVPLGQGKYADVWLSADGKTWNAYSKSAVSGTQISNALTKTSKYLASAAEGKVRYRSNIFRVTPKGNTFVISVTNINTGVTQAFDLPKQLRGKVGKYIIDEMALLISKNTRLSLPESRRVAQEFLSKCKNSSDAMDRFKASPAFSREAIFGSTLKSSLAGFSLAMVIDAFSQYASNQKIDVEQLAKVSMLGAVSGFSAKTAANILTIGLAKNGLMSGMYKFVPSTTAAVLATSIFAYGDYLLGNGTLEAANRSFIIGAGSALAYGLGTTGLMAGVAMFGTASTGTPIAALSGAAAAKATLAYLGFGSVASGGLGVAGGALVLTGFGTIVAAVAVPVIMGVMNYMDKQERHQMIEGRLRFLSSSI